MTTRCDHPDDGDTDSGDDGDAGAARVAARLNGRRVATAESCTAGRIATALATVPGAADFLAGSVVAYFESVKRDMLGVTGESVYTPEAAVEMAEGVRMLLDVECAVATTGVAGGEPQDGVEAGTVFIATAVNGHTRAITYRFDGSPDDVCAAAARRALIDLAVALERHESEDAPVSSADD